MLELEAICIDCGDPVSLGTFWHHVLGWPLSRHDDGDVTLTSPDGNGRFELYFAAVPDEKVVKNRLHLDLRPDDQDAEVARLEALGARRTDIGQGEQTWVVMADPEGNEFCVLRSRS